MILRPPFGLQWHITPICDQKCRHCYMYDGPRYQEEVKNQLGLDQCKQVIDDYVACLRQWNAIGSIAFTGGDPLLRGDFFDILAHACEQGLGGFLVMGNPFHLSPEVCEKLKQHRVVAYQMSIDGLEKTHDWNRGPGCFQKTLDAFRLLGEHGIERASMTTLTPENKDQLPDIMRLGHELGLEYVSWARVALEGNAGDNYGASQIDPFEFRELYKQAMLLARELEYGGSYTRFDRKDHLWVPLAFEEGWIDSMEQLRATGARRCGMGLGGLTVLSDGTVMPCRRFTEPVGKVPEQSFRDIWTGSEVLHKVRESDNHMFCSKCGFKHWCLGCSAVASGVNQGDYFGPDPQCWRIAAKKRFMAEHGISEIPEDAEMYPPPSDIAPGRSRLDDPPVQGETSA